MARFMGLVFGVVVVVLMQCAAAQTVHVVGDSIGWTVPQGGASAYTNWASSKQFVVGDILLFNFTTGEHDVQQVQKSSFDACTSTNPIGNLITTGPANITLDTTGEHYYICTIGSHCQLGQKLAINVSGSPGASPPSTTPTPAPPTTMTPPTTPSPTSGTPAGCVPPPMSGPTAGGPTPATPGPTSPPPPGSSSSKVLASVMVSVLAIVMGLVF